MQVVSDAPVLHYNGERKPWGTNPFAEYVKAMGYWGQNLTGLPQAKNPEPEQLLAKEMQLVVLLSGPRTGTEWLAKVIHMHKSSLSPPRTSRTLAQLAILACPLRQVMADDSYLVCGSIDDRTAPHPESLMPYDVACDNATQIPCTSWHVVGPRNDSCDLRLMCQWRYVLAASRGTSVTPGAGMPGSAGLDSYEKVRMYVPLSTCLFLYTSHAHTHARTLWACEALMARVRASARASIAALLRPDGP